MLASYEIQINLITNFFISRTHSNDFNCETRPWGPATVHGYFLFVIIFQPKYLEECVSPYFTLANAELNTTADDGPHTITVIKF